MDITGIAKSHHAGIQKPSSKKEWKLSDSLREKIAGYAREDAVQGVYMGNKFLALRKNRSICGKRCEASVEFSNCFGCAVPYRHMDIL